jgi:glucose-6-phosphate dehydrogenase assembly protein OpcA
MATKKKLIEYSWMGRTADKVITDSITIKEPAATHMKPRIAKNK